MAAPTPALGTGVNVAEVYERGGQRRLFKVPAVSSIEWGRTLDGISRATVEVSRENLSGGETWKECGQLLKDVHPWGHEIVVFRDGARVWEGPIRRPSQNRAGVTLAASDVLGWTERRVMTSGYAGEFSILDKAVEMLTAAFSDDPNVVAYIQALGSDAVTTVLDIKPVSGYYSAALANLVTAGLYYTVVGRAPLLWADTAYTLGRTNILNPTRHLVGDLETAREGDELATEAWAANDQGEWSSAGGSDAFYGMVQRLLSASGVAGSDALFYAAQRWIKQRTPAPESLTVPDGSTLHCDAPFPIEVLVPGVLTDVKVTDLCWPVEQTMQLTSVKVTQDSAGEKVGVSYAPITGDETVA